MIEASASKLALWRAAIALAWVDHDLHPEEKQQLHDFFDQNVHLSEAQAAELHAAIDHKIDLASAWEAITDKQDRAHLINIAPVIFWQDDAFHHSEKEVYDRICKDHESTLNLQQDMEDAQKMAAEFRVQWAKDAQEYRELRSRMGPVGWVMHQLGKKLAR